MNTLTAGEKAFIVAFLKSNQCGAKTANELLDDNFSWQNAESFCHENEQYSVHQFGGFVASLGWAGKGVLTQDGDDFYVNECFLEKLSEEGKGDTPFSMLVGQE